MYLLSKGMQDMISFQTKFMPNILRQNVWYSGKNYPDLTENIIKNVSWPQVRSGLGTFRVWSFPPGLQLKHLPWPVVVC